MGVIGGCVKIFWETVLVDVVLKVEGFWIRVWADGLFIWGWIGTRELGCL